MELTVSGSCFCGEAVYEITGNMGLFQYCHCSRCRKVSGSAHGANLFVKPEQFRWIKGEDKVRRFEPAHTKHFATAFCTQCGSNLPWLTKTGRAVVIPAGTLDAHPQIEPTASNYFASRAPWYRHVSELPMYDELPPKA